MLIHGASVFVMMAGRRLENPEHARALMALREMVSPAVPAFAILIIVTGVIAASMANWWSMSWPGVSLVLFIGIAIVMTILGRRYFERVSKALASDAQFAEIAARPPLAILMLVGIGVVGIITWLTLFKPF